VRRNALTPTNNAPACDERGVPLIIGGGPAGTAAAITLARAGHRPILLERKSHPTDKVCGDFLGTDAIQLVLSLGVDPTALGAMPIHRVRLVHNDRTAEATLPFPALGLSRRTLDAALLCQAEHVGAEIHTGHTVRRLIHTSGQWSAQTGDNNPFRSDTVFLATGKHDLRDLPRPGASSGAIGIKMYFTLRSEAARTLERTIELTLFPGGYAGMQPVEHGQAVLCIAIQRRVFQACGGNWPGLIAAIGQRSPRFATMLAGAIASLPRPLAVAGIPYGYQAAVAPTPTLFRLGDQAAVIPSLTGDGMAIALHSGKSAAEAWLAGSDAAAYHQSLTRMLAPQMRLAGLLHHACMNGLVQAAVVRAVAMFPALLRRSAIHTRLSSNARPAHG
jgi:flavin-dependent dehydrogenase